MRAVAAGAAPSAPRVRDVPAPRLEAGKAQAARAAINMWIGDDGPEGIPSAAPERIAPARRRPHDEPEVVFNA
ncbi:hypothetical protein [Actinocorallia aurantiaca]|uniref:Uncharacterized protein n=1 Tax=Actinocorallia aurantiaca TaxID=46204 RepID=A0ABN3U4Q6_9ACTN